MSDIVIHCERLGKQYRRGERAPYRRFTDVVTALATSPLRWLRRAGQSAPAATSADPKFWALKDVSFEVKQGEVLGIIGRNGAGKSTLLKVLSGITDPTEGEVRIRGRIGSLLEVGTGFHPELTGRENIFLNGAILGMRKDEIRRKFDEIVDFAEIESFLDTPVKHYSSGMYMRLAFAVAAHLEPEILVVDEVLAVGDSQFQKKCLGKMGEVAKGGRTILFVSHNMNAIEELCSHVLLLSHGRVQRDDNSVRETIREYIVGSHSGSQTSQWRNGGNEFENEWFKPLRMWLSGPNDEGIGVPVSNIADLSVNIEGEVRSGDPALVVGIALYAEDGQLLFWSCHTDGRESSWPRLEPGLFCFRVCLPRRFLNEGNYRVEMVGALHFRQWLFEPSGSVPSLILSIQGGLSDSPYWMARRPGLIAPLLKWSVGRSDIRPAPPINA